jgi:hypothetical protein
MEDFDFAVRLDYDERLLHPEIFYNLRSICIHLHDLEYIYLGGWLNGNAGI